MEKRVEGEQEGVQAGSFVPSAGDFFEGRGDGFMGMARCRQREVLGEGGV